MGVLSYYDVLDIPAYANYDHIYAAWIISDQSDEARRAYESLMDWDKKVQLDHFFTIRHGSVIRIVVSNPNLLETGGWITCQSLEFDVETWPIQRIVRDGKLVLSWEPKTVPRCAEFYVTPGTEFDVCYEVRTGLERTMEPASQTSASVDVMLVRPKENETTEISVGERNRLIVELSKLPLNPKIFMGVIGNFVQNKIPRNIHKFSDVESLDFSDFQSDLNKNMLLDRIADFLTRRGFFAT